MQQQPERRRPDDALPAEAVDIALSFIEIAVHAVLFARGIYPREAFSRAVRGEIALPYGVEDAILNMRVIDALFASSASAQWERV
jgi:predicted dehydrogenase